MFGRSELDARLLWKHVLGSGWEWKLFTHRPGVSTGSMVEKLRKWMMMLMGMKIGDGLSLLMHHKGGATTAQLRYREYVSLFLLFHRQEHHHSMIGVLSFFIHIFFSIVFVFWSFNGDIFGTFIWDTDTKKWGHMCCRRNSRCNLFRGQVIFV